VEVVSHGARLPSQYVDVDLDVASRLALTLTTQPRMIRARRGARFVLELANDGNVPLDVNLTAVDADRAVRTELTPPTLRVEAGAVAPVLLTVRGPRMFTGGEIDRTVTVAATGRGPAPQADGPLEHDGPETCETTVRLRQRPLVSRGLLTALILASIVALWAGVFLLGLTKVFSGDPMTKQAPASFFLPAGGAGGSGGSGAGSGGGSGGAAAAPADALPKSGQVPAGTGGAISGTVTSVNDHQPVGRILVQALRVGRKGPVLVSSAATQADGTYTLGGLFPTDYYLEFSAAGFVPVWYPSAPGQSGAQTVAAVAQGTTSGVNAVIAGKPASISGTINPGDTLTPVVTTVSARPLVGGNTTKP
ncbi:MAG: carboxypeptidase-like regulatory domain-containing protein, partial [Acidimicrobiales bacterium]